LLKKLEPKIEKGNENEFKMHEKTKKNKKINKKLFLV